MRLVLKCGGSVAGDAATLIEPFLEAGHEVCVVHGAGPQISAEMERFGIPVEFVGGRRVTSAAGLAIVRASLLAVNRVLCAQLGPRAVGLLGDEVGLHAVQIPVLGLVGDPLPSRPPAIEAALVAGRVPVVAPLAVGPLEGPAGNRPRRMTRDTWSEARTQGSVDMGYIDEPKDAASCRVAPVRQPGSVFGQALNVNADEAAAALAVGLGADRILFLTDVPGLLRDGSVVQTIGTDEADDLLDSGALEGGILPKLRAAVTAARLGVQAEIGETSVLA